MRNGKNGAEFPTLGTTNNKKNSDLEAEWRDFGVIQSTGQWRLEFDGGTPK